MNLYRYNAICFAPEDGTGAPAAGNEGTGGENNTSTPDPLEAFWEPGVPARGSAPNQPAPAPAPAPQKVNPMDVLAERLKGYNFGNPFSHEAMSEAATSGDYSGINAALNQTVQQAVLQALLMSARMMDSSKAGMQELIDGRINTHLAANKAETKMESTFDWAKDPKFRPMAQFAMGAALRKTGGDVDKAADLASLLMETFSEALPSKANGAGTPPNSVGGMGNNQMVSTEDGDPITDWMMEAFGGIMQPGTQK